MKIARALFLACACLSVASARLNEIVTLDMADETSDVDNDVEEESGEGSQQRSLFSFSGYSGAHFSYSQFSTTTSSSGVPPPPALSYTQIHGTPSAANSAAGAAAAAGSGNLHTSSTSSSAVSNAQTQVNHQGLSTFVHFPTAPVFQTMENCADTCEMNNGDGIYVCREVSDPNTFQTLNVTHCTDETKTLSGDACGCCDPSNCPQVCPCDCSLPEGAKDMHGNYLGENATGTAIRSLRSASHPFMCVPKGEEVGLLSEGVVECDTLCLE